MSISGLKVLKVIEYLQIKSVSFVNRARQILKGGYFETK